MKIRLLASSLAVLVWTIAGLGSAYAEETTQRNVLICDKVSKKAVTANAVVTGSGSYSLALYVRITAADRARYTENGYLAGQTGDAIGIFNLI